MTGTGTPEISTLELVRVGWPIVFACLCSLWACASLFFMARQTRKDLDTFKNQEYKEDRADVLNAVKRLEATQKEAEQKLEAKLDKMANVQKESESKLDGKLDRMASITETKLEKIADSVNQTNVFLAELKGRAYSKSQENSL